MALADTELDPALLDVVAAEGRDLDAHPAPVRFPSRAFAALRDAGLLALPATYAEQLALVRAVSAVHGSAGRILDGHLNALERLAVHGEDAGDALWGVWGADPAPGEGDPARLTPAAAAPSPPEVNVRSASLSGPHRTFAAGNGDGSVLRGVKTYCSGAGGVERALVLAGDRLVAVDLAERVVVDEGWYRANGLRASCSHRVVFEDADVLAVLGGPGEILVQPLFARDAVRTAATWAGLADAAAAAARRLLGARPARGDLEHLAAGRIETHRRTIDLWMAAAAAAPDARTTPVAEDPGVPVIDAAFAAHARDAIASACRALLDEALRACGSRPLATGDDLDRVRRDLDVFLLQHRLDPIVARAGAALLPAS